MQREGGERERADEEGTWTNPHTKLQTTFGRFQSGCILRVALLGITDKLTYFAVDCTVNQHGVSPPETGKASGTDHAQCIAERERERESGQSPCDVK